MSSDAEAKSYGIPEQTEAAEGAAGSGSARATASGPAGAVTNHPVKPEGEMMVFMTRDEWRTFGACLFIIGMFITLNFLGVAIAAAVLDHRAGR